MTKRAARAVGAALAALALSAPGVAVSASPAREVRLPDVGQREAQARTRVVVVLKAPKKVGVSLRLAGPGSAAVAKKPGNGHAKVRLRLRPGRYAVHASAATSDGKRYLPRRARSRLVVSASAPARLEMSWTLDRTDPRLRATEVSERDVTLRWQRQARGRTVVLRRAAGSRPPSSRRQGTAVRIRKNGKLVDAGVRRGRTYAYSMFVRTPRGWSRPSSVVVTTGGDQGESALRSGALALPKPPVVEQISGSEATVTLPRGTDVPPVGAGVLLPASEELPAGLVGKVVADLGGGKVRLGPGSLTDVFSHLDLSLDLADLPATDVLDDTAAIRASRCSSGNGAVNVSNIGFAIESLPSGSIRVTIRSGPLGVPVGAVIDTEITMRSALTADVEATLSGSCSVRLPRIGKTFKAKVPLAVLFEPEVSFTAAARISSPATRVAVTFGAWGQVSAGLGGVPPRGGHILRDPAITMSPRLEGSTSVKLGGQLTFGIGTLDDSKRSNEVRTGGVAGISGYAYLIDGSITALPGNTWANPCVQVDAATTAGLTLRAMAFANLSWAGDWSAEATWPIPGANHRVRWPGHPRSFPQNCPTAPPPPPPTSGTRITAGDQGAGTPAVSTDGRWVAFESTSTNLVPGDTNASSDLFLWDRSTRTTRRLTGDPYTLWQPPDISGDGRFVVTVSGSAWNDPTPDPSRLVLLDTANGSSRALPTGGWALGGSARISRDGRYVTFSTGQNGTDPGAVLVVDVSTGTVRQVSAPDHDAYGSDISADGRFVAYSARPAGNTERRIHRWDRSSGAVTQLTFGNDNVNPLISDDGSRVVFSGTGGVGISMPDGSLRSVAASPSGGSSITGNGLSVGHYRFDDNLMNPVASVWDAGTGASSIVAGPPALSPVLSGDGRTVVYTGTAGDLYLTSR